MLQRLQRLFSSLSEITIVGLCLLFVATSLVFAQDILPIPALSGRVIDQTATLSAKQIQALSEKLATLEQSTGAQVVVLLVPTTLPEDNAAFAQRIADQWKLGRRDIGDGVLIVVAKNDRKVRIEVAKTLEGAIPDLAAKRIIREQITPAFKAGDFAGGLNAAIDQLAARIQNEKLPTHQSPSTPGLQWEELSMLFFIGVPVLGGLLTAAFGRKLGSLVTGSIAGGLGWWLTASAILAGAASLLALVLVGVLGIGASRRGSNLGLGSYGGLSTSWRNNHSNGGFSSGGGGDFGGGGASGDW